MLKSVVQTAVVFGILLMLCACNTIQGVGRDITSVGEFLEDITQ